MKVLIVDDSKYARNLVKSYLVEMPGKWEIIEASDGKETLAQLEQIYSNGSKIHLILLDWNMPNMLGIDCLKAIRADDKYKDIKIIIITSDGAKANVVSAIKAGATDFMVKQIDPILLQEKLNKLFGDFVYL
ncbi:MAG: chemotaxis response regulator CheY [Termitinemataceae bacterium]|nr:MAG: chemotaxis response regulator CheY [Termitinemataceae bacterium]